MNKEILFALILLSSLVLAYSDRGWGLCSTSGMVNPTINACILGAEPRYCDSQGKIIYNCTACNCTGGTVCDDVSGACVECTRGEKCTTSNADTFILSATDFLTVVVNSLPLLTIFILGGFAFIILFDIKRLNQW